MKKLSWLLTAVVGSLAFYACTILPPAGGPAPTLHVASRYLARGRMETGFSNLEAAVFSDYRSFDLFLLGFFFGALALSAALAYPPGEGAPRASRRRAWAVSGLGLLVLLGVGLATLEGGGNFLDYEPFARFFPPHLAREGGACLLALGAALAAGGGLFLWADLLKRHKEADLGR